MKINKILKFAKRGYIFRFFELYRAKDKKSYQNRKAGIHHMYKLLNKQDARLLAERVCGPPIKIESDKVIVRCPHCGTDGAYIISVTSPYVECVSCNKSESVITVAVRAGVKLTPSCPPEPDDMLLNHLSEDAKPSVFLKTHHIDLAVAQSYGLVANRDKLVAKAMDKDGRVLCRSELGTEIPGKLTGIPHLFGLNMLTGDETVVVTTNKIDALMLASKGIKNVVSIEGTDVEQSIANDAEILAGYSRVIMIGSSDSISEDVFKALDKAIDKPVYRTSDFTKSPYYASNLAEMIVELDIEGLNDYINSATSVLPAGVESFYDVKYVGINDIVFIPTGIEHLDNSIGGIPQGMVTVITGATGCGKSTLVSQFCISALKIGKTVGIYSGEMIAGYVKDTMAHQCFTEEELSTVGGRCELSEKLKKKFDEEYGHKAYIFTSFNLELITQTVKARQLSLLVIDNLMTAINSTSNGDTAVGKNEYQMQAQLVSKLVEMARRLNVAIILVAHSRKDNGIPRANKTAVSDISGSADIGNLAALVIGCSRKDDDEMGLEIAKMRFEPISAPEKKITLQFNTLNKRYSTN